MSRLQKALFLSDKGYADLKKAIFACTLTNLAMLLPFCVTVMIFSEILTPFVSCLLYTSSYGLFNTVLQALGFAPVNWLNNPDTAMGCIIFMNLWKNVGYYTLIIMSALKSIPTEIYEAATLDRAGTLRTFFKITLPMLSPQIFFLLITITTGSFMVFDSINVMTAGGPGNSTEVLARYIYKYAFTLNKLGVASAACTVLMLILILITFLDFKGLEKKVHYQYERLEMSWNMFPKSNGSGGSAIIYRICQGICSRSS